VEMKRKVRESVLHTNSPQALAKKYLEQYQKAVEIYEKKHRFKRFSKNHYL